MGQISNKTFTMPDGSDYRVESDGSITKIKVPHGVDNNSNASYRVVLQDAGKQKLLVVKTITELTNYSLKPAKAIVDYTPAVIIDGVSQSRALQIKSEFDNIGAVVTVELSNKQTKTIETNVETYSDGYQMPSRQSAGCFGVILLFIISTITVIASL